MKPRYTDAFWGEHPFDGDMILIKNKNKNNKIPASSVCSTPYYEVLRQHLNGLNLSYDD